MGARCGRLALALLVVGAAACDGAPRREDLAFDRFVLVSIDTLRADRLGAYGYPRATTPFIDGLARRGVVFERAYSAISTTAPAHASMFTSLYPIQHRLLKNGLKLRQEHLTLAELLADAGFQTGGFASTAVHFGVGNLDQGFDVFDEPSDPEAGYRAADATVDAALRWVRGFSADDRFLLFVHLYDVHTPYRPPAEYLELFTEQPASRQRALARFLVEEQHFPIRFFPNGEAGLLELAALYDAELRFVDAELARLFQGFGEAGLGERTLWLVTADHGEGLGNHHFVEHVKNIYEEQVRVPLIAFSSDPPLAARRVPEIVEHVDLLPTLARLVGRGVPTGSGIRGRPLPLLEGESFADGGTRTAFSQRRTFANLGRSDVADDQLGRYEMGDKFAWMEARWKYIHRSIGPDELYDLAEDPYETHNRLREEPERAAELRARLLERVRTLRAERRAGAEPVDPETAERLRALGYLP